MVALVISVIDPDLIISFTAFYLRASCTVRSKQFLNFIKNEDLRIGFCGLEPKGGSNNGDCG